MYESISYLIKYTEWFVLLISGCVGLRCTVVLFQAYLNNNFPEAFNKCKNILMASAVGLCMGSSIAFFRRYF